MAETGDDQVSDVFGNTLLDLDVESQTQTHASMPLAARGLVDLPQELLIEIFSSLEPVQLNITRLVCKRWYFAILNQDTWARSFRLKLGTPTASFPTVSNSPNWMREYFARVHVLKKWRKLNPVHKFYPMMNNELRYVDACFATFSNNDGYGRMLTFSRRFGHIAIANTRNGKSQSFIPGGADDIIGYDISWSYLAYGTTKGGLYLRNLLTSTSTSTSRVSIKQLHSADHEATPITAVCLNSNNDKHKQKADVLSGTHGGRFSAHSLSGSLMGSFTVENSPILHIKSDFRTLVIVSTATSLHFLEYPSFTPLQSVDLGFQVEIDLTTFANRTHSYTGPPETEPPQLDVDFGGSNVIVSYRQHIVVFRFDDLSAITKSTISIPRGLTSVYSALQTTNPTKLNSRNSRDVSLAGKDGLLYANSLSDGSVVVWNVRDTSTSIVPHCTIYPQLNKDLHEGVRCVTAIALNSSVLALGGYNGYTNIYNVFTGKLIRLCSVKYPRKFGLHDVLMPVLRILLDLNQHSSCGVILCGDAVQYFQFGDLEATREQTRRLNVGNRKKHKFQKQIHDGMEEYNSHVYTEMQMVKRFDKYNGDKFSNEEEELAVALVLSESIQKDSNEDEDLRLAIQLSEMSEHADNPEKAMRNLNFHDAAESMSPAHAETGETDSEDDDLKRAIALSLMHQ